jgi:hypothetical protein
MAPYVKITQKLLMRCELFSDECAKKCSIAEYKHQVLLLSLALASSGILEYKMQHTTNRSC